MFACRWRCIDSVVYYGRLACIIHHALVVSDFKLDILSHRICQKNYTPSKTDDFLNIRWLSGELVQLQSTGSWVQSSGRDSKIQYWFFLSVDSQYQPGVLRISLRSCRRCRSIGLQERGNRECKQRVHLCLRAHRYGRIRLNDIINHYY